MNRKVINGKDVLSSGPYLHAMDTGEYVFIAGQTGYNGKDYDGEKYTIAKQTELCFKNLEDIMEQVNVTYEEIVKVNVYLTSMDYFSEVNEIYATKFKDPFPPRTCVAVYQLPLEADIEIELTIKRK